MTRTIVSYVLAVGLATVLIVVWLKNVMLNLMAVLS